MSKLPLRFRILKEIWLEGNGHNIKTIMEALESEYGQEKQFHEPAFLDHLLSLKENGLIAEESIDLDEQDELLVTYKINEAGSEILRKYLPKEHKPILKFS